MTEDELDSVLLGAEDVRLSIERCKDCDKTDPTGMWRAGVLALIGTTEALVRRVRELEAR